MSELVTRAGMLAAEAEALAAGHSEESLMEEAGAGIAGLVAGLWPGVAGRLVVYLGKGNNAGDALVAARRLAGEGWRVEARLAGRRGELGELAAKHLAAGEAGGWLRVLDGPARAACGERLLLFDGLLGIGGRGDLRGGLLELSAEMAALREWGGALVVAMDLPSGLDANTGEAGAGAVRADLTAAVGAVKVGLVADGAEDHVGRIGLVEVGAIPCGRHGCGAGEVLVAGGLRRLLGRRAASLHKGGAGRVVVMGGSEGMEGAGVLAAMGALRGGAGLVTLVVPEGVRGVVAGRCPAEVMVRGYGPGEEGCVASLMEACDAAVVGPGLGRGDEVWVMVRRLVEEVAVPMVIDADGLAALAAGDCGRAGAGRVVTPHPGEMARLCEVLGVGGSGVGRAEVARLAGAALGGATVLLKGARTVVAGPGGELCYNSTGHPGMATGGSGDVLAGVIGALLAGGLGGYGAACAGAWLCGRAAELALGGAGRLGEEGFAAGDLAGAMGAAFAAMREGLG
jgi:ADP-dependent NAD(P)H-hydrate dehydratase / NAD(P)H-hydrate epimerase